MSDIRLINDTSSGRLFYVDLDNIAIPALGTPTSIWEFNGNVLDSEFNYNAHLYTIYSQQASYGYLYPDEVGFLPTYDASGGIDLNTCQLFLGNVTPFYNTYGPNDVSVRGFNGALTTNLVAEKMDDFMPWTFTQWLRYPDVSLSASMFLVTPGSNYDPGAEIPFCSGWQLIATRYSGPPNFVPGDTSSGYFRLSFTRSVNEPSSGITWVKGATANNLDINKWYFITASFERPIMYLNIWDTSGFLVNKSLNTYTDFYDVSSYVDAEVATFRLGSGYSLIDVVGDPSLYEFSAAFDLYYQPGVLSSNVRFYDYSVDLSTLENIWNNDKDNKI